MMRLRNSKGDTLIEVLLAIAVLSSIIGITYGTASRAQRNTQASQQRAEASAVAQTQLERLRGLRDVAAASENDFLNLFVPAHSAPGAVFCIDVAPTYNIIDASPPGVCNFGTNNRYHAQITFNTTERKFEVSVTWQAQGAAITNRSVMVYRLW